MELTNLTYHARVEREQRIAAIKAKIGLGQIVKEYFNRGCYTCITDTGVTIIKTADKATVVTVYVTTFAELVAAYNGVKKIPPFLRKKVDRNQSLFTQHGKTML